ncbi:MAG: MFS transporter [Clostridia bacterium]|nr:MFS transporter [Clostridia bacterium]
MNIQTIHTFYIFWAGQTLSQLGSAMTGFALILWAFEGRGSALTVSLMAFCSYVPYVLASLLAGGVVDRRSPKGVLLVCDLLAAMGTGTILAAAGQGRLRVGLICAVNVFTGLMNAFQSPAASAAVGRLAPKDRLSRVSGLQAMGSNLNAVLSPVLAAALYGMGGLPLVLAIDLTTFAAAFLSLLVLQIPAAGGEAGGKAGPFAGLRAGVGFLQGNRDILRLIVTIAGINFFSRLTYENILSPMLLARSGNDRGVLAMVNACMGAAGIAGGLWVARGREMRDPFGAVYLSAALSFLSGDLLMGLGRGGCLWALAGIFASLPIPRIFAAQELILYRRIPKEMQGRVFAVRNAIQYSTIPIGILLGGWLADRVFEPFMSGGSILAQRLSRLVGSGAGAGMALMFLSTGILGGGFCLHAHRKSRSGR